MILFPLYLAGAVALGVPIVVHLRNRQTAQVQRFPTLRFLLAARVVSSRWREVMRWIVLALRLLALAALILAFARPWFASPPPPIPGLAAVLVVDVSASLQAQGAWESCRRRAEAWLAEQPPEARIALLAVDRQVRQLTGFADGAPARRAALEALAPGAAGTDLDAALRAADRLLAEQGAERRVIALASDAAASAVRRIAFDRPLSPGVSVDLLGDPGRGGDNVAVAELLHDPAIEVATRPLELGALLRNHGDAARSLRVRCEVDGGEPQEREIALPPRGGAELRFALRPTAGQALTGRVRVLDARDALAIDDQRFFAVPTRASQDVLRVAAPGADDRFLAAATAPADGGRFRWRAIDAASLATLTPRDLLVIDAGVAIDETGREALRRHRRDGGGIALWCGADAAGWEAEILGVAPGALSERAEPAEPAAVAVADLRHPILQPFAQPQSGDLQGFAVRRWRAPTGTGLRPLLRLEDGTPLLAVSEAKHRLAVLALRPERSWSAWPAHETFVPVWQQTLRWLAGGAARRGGNLVGAPGVAATAPGIHPGSDGQPLAVNVDPDESDLARWTHAEAFAALRNPDPATPPAQLAAAERERAGRALAWWLLIAVAALSFAELLVANRTPR